MRSELIDLSPTRKEIKIQIEAQKVREAYDRVSDQYAKAANVPGFRKGHAPRSVVRTRFKSEIRGDVLRELVPDAINDAISEHSIRALGEPNVELDNAEGLDKLGQEPITVKVGVEVLPEVTLGDYRGIEVSRKLRPITDDDMQRMLDGLRDASASLQPVEDRPSETGDLVTVNLLGKILDSPNADEIKVDDIEVEVGGEGVQLEFTENLAGVKPEDKKKFTVVYPEDFQTKELAGHKVEYEAEVTGVRRKELPEIDDEWAQSLGEEYDSLETLKKKIREDLEKRAETDADNRVRRELIDKLLEGHKFEVPESLVEHEANHRLQSLVRDMVRRGVDPRSSQIDWEGARTELKDQAENDVRASMLLEEIADTEKISVTDEEIDAEIEAISNASRQPKEQVRAVLTKDGGERSIAQRLRNRKALDLLIDNAHVTEETWSEEDL